MAARARAEAEKTGDRAGSEFESGPERAATNGARGDGKTGATNSGPAADACQRPTAPKMTAGLRGKGKRAEVTRAPRAADVAERLTEAGREAFEGGAGACERA